MIGMNTSSPAYQQMMSQIRKNQTQFALASSGRQPTYSGRGGYTVPAPTYNQRQSAEPARPQWPSYEQAISGYRNDPLTELYTGRRYQDTPLSREEYDYLRLSERYGGLSGPQLGQEQRRASQEPYQFGTGQNQNSYAYYQWLQGELKGRQEEEKRKQEAFRQQGNKMLSGMPTPGGQRFVHFLTPDMRRAMGISDANVAQSKMAYQQYQNQQSAWGDRKQEIAYRNMLESRRQAEQRDRDMQSAAARGFYQTPLAYQNL